MNKIGSLNFKKIQRISPSQFYSMKNCAYKSLLSEAMDKKALLPVSANAYYGTVLHKMLELITTGAIRTEDDFNSMFDDQIRLMEQRLINDGYSFFVPLQTRVKDFTMKKILLKEHLRPNTERHLATTKVNFLSEKWYESKDKLIGGKIDLIIEGKDSTEIIDFKTGAITENLLDEDGEINTEVKAEYKEQLKLYAYLYYENTNKFPTQLSLVDLAKEKFTIDFSEKECNTIFEEAKSLLKSTNNCIDEGTFTANPTESNCKYCLYRPACSFYLNLLESDNSFNDITGSIQNVIRFQNGNVNLYLQSGNEIYTISNLPSEKFDELNDNKNKKINVFNLKKESKDFFLLCHKNNNNL